MPNTVVEYKNWLFVKVPEDIVEIEMTFSGEKVVFWHKDGIGYEQELVGSWQIIGKADQLKEEDWERIFWDGWDIEFNTATEAGRSLLLSHGLKPEECLVIKKIEG